ncbi:hypothetical protein EDB89DRAFT_399708 [Lactarius sanguifluus]|nr:hypothetical protein EDB89DRAFT_399708 [Lactarius sanguifluus]
MYDTISGSISLRYLLELVANGMRDDHRSTLGKIQRLNLLAEHETAWRTLSWSDNTSIDTLDGWGEPVSVSGNIIAFRNAYAKPDASSEELLLLRAPSKLRNVQTKRWVVQLPHDTQDVCIKLCAGFARISHQIISFLLPFDGRKASSGPTLRHFRGC